MSGGERGTKGKRSLTLKDRRNPMPWAEGVTNVIVSIYRSGTAARGARDEGETKDERSLLSGSGEQSGM